MNGKDTWSCGSLMPSQAYTDRLPLVPVAHGNPGATFALSSYFSPSEHRVSNLGKLESLLPAPRLSCLGLAWLHC